MTYKLAALKKGNQYARQQNLENLGIFIINKTVVITCTCNGALTVVIEISMYRCLLL